MILLIWYRILIKMTRIKWLGHAKPMHHIGAKIVYKAEEREVPIEVAGRCRE
jgi:hypothetical protein